MNNSIYCESIINFRLLSKYSTPQYSDKCIYRSGTLTYINEIDLNILKNNLLINTYIDLRSYREVYKQGKTLKLLDIGINYIHCPVSILDNKFFNKVERNKNDYFQHYTKYLNCIRNPLIIICQELMSGNNVIFGCYSGKDRTGVLSAILLKIFGYKNEYIAKDYAKSYLYLKPYYKLYLKDTLSNISYEQYLERMSSDYRIMMMFLTYFDEHYTNVGHYLRSINFPKYLYNYLSDISFSKYDRTLKGGE